MLRSPGVPGFSETARRDTSVRHRLVTGEAYPHSPTMLAMPNPSSAPLPERPILVVDDDAKIVRLVRTYLERDGFGVVTAADGPAALDAIETPPARARRPRPHAPGARRAGGHPGRPARRRGRRDADPRPVGARLHARPDRGSRGWRRRLPAQAVQPGRARPPGQVDPPPRGTDVRGRDDTPAARSTATWSWTSTATRSAATAADRPDPRRVPAAPGHPRGRRPGAHPRPAPRRGLRPGPGGRAGPDGRRPRRAPARQARRRRRSPALRRDRPRDRLSRGRAGDRDRPPP